MRRIRGLRTLLSLLCLVTVGGGVSHAGIIAQYDAFADGGTWTRSTFYSNYVMAQSFVAAVDGTVVSIDTVVQKYQTSITTIPIRFSITGTRNSEFGVLQPDFGNVLSTGTLSASDPVLTGIFIDWVNTTMTPAALKAGTAYMLVATAAGTNQDYDWYLKYGSGVTGYPGGNEMVGYIGDSALGRSDSDLPFRINGADAADVPEPATWVGLGMGLLVLGAARLRTAASGRR